MIKCNHYKLKDQDVEFLIYGEEFDVPETFELLHENVDPSTSKFRNLELLNSSELYARIFSKRTVDKTLEEAGIRSFNDLSNAYFLIKTKELNKSRRVREYVEQKYIQVIELVNNGCREITGSSSHDSGGDSGSEECNFDEAVDRDLNSSSSD